MKSLPSSSLSGVRALRLGALLTAFTLAPGAALAEIALQFGGADLVTERTNLVRQEGRGVVELAKPISPPAGYTGPAFTGGYGRSNNGSVDRAEIDNNTGPYGLDMLGFTESAMGRVDRIYGLVRFPSSSFTPRFANKPIRLARSEALSVRTYTGYLPDQRGWFYFYVESQGKGYLSPPFSYTNEVDAEWGEKTITVANPRTVAWTLFATKDNSPELASGRPAATPDFDRVTAVGFYFETHVTGGDKNATRLLTDFFLVNAEAE